MVRGSVPMQLTTTTGAITVNRLPRIIALALAGLCLTATLGACGQAASAPITTEKVISAFTAAGLEADSPSPMAREDYKLAPYSRDVAGVRFLMPSLGPDTGGRVFVGPDADLTRLETYFTEVGKASAAFYSHVFRHGNALVQITGTLSDAQAAKYEAALKGL